MMRTMILRGAGAASARDAVARLPRQFGRVEKLAFAREVARLAVRSLHAELCLYPKPGLVSPVDSGSHDDMDAETFMRSMFALRHYFKKICLAGMDDAPFAQLKALGIAAEAAMLRATRGVNTHRGAIFSLGMLCATVGRARAQCTPLTPAALRAAMLIRWGEELAMHAAPGSDATADGNAPAARGAPADGAAAVAAGTAAVAGGTAAVAAGTAAVAGGAVAAGSAVVAGGTVAAGAAAVAAGTATVAVGVAVLAGGAAVLAGGGVAAVAGGAAVAASGAGAAGGGADVAVGGRSGVALSNGLRVAARYAVSGAREEGALGLPSVFEIGLPALLAARARGATVTEERVDTLYTLMAHVSDSNVYHRAGPQGAQIVRDHAERFLALGGTTNAGWYAAAVASHHVFMQHRLSPGGAADLLAACCFVQSLAALDDQ